MERGYLTRRFSQRLLVYEELNPRVVIAVGGWDSFAAIEPYLPEPTEDVTDSAFASGQIFSITESYNGGKIM